MPQYGPDPTTPETETVTVDAEDPSARLTVTVVDASAGEPTIDLAGELTGGTSSGLIEAIRRNADAGATLFRVDMSRLSFMDGRGLAAVIVAARMAADAGAGILFDRPSSLCRRLLELAGLGHLCPGRSGSSSGGAR
jgi:anti-anti-sigma factor